MHSKQAMLTKERHFFSPVFMDTIPKPSGTHSGISNVTGTSMDMLSVA